MLLPLIGARAARLERTPASRTISTAIERHSRPLQHPTREKEAFAPLDAKNVRMYVCGPTVYDFAHIGNARPVVVFDMLFRLLRHVYGEEHVTYVRNITDIDDKIMDAAKASGESIAELTDAHRPSIYHDDMGALNALRPSQRAARDRVRAADGRDDGDAGRARATPMRRKATCCSTSRRWRITASCRAARSTT